MRKWLLLLAGLSVLLLFNCAAPPGGGDTSNTYDIQGTVKLWDNTPLSDVTITAGTKTATSDTDGNWSISGLTGTVTVSAQKNDYYIVVAGTVNPSKSVSNASTINFTAYSETEEMAGGLGTKDSPFIIVNVEQLNAIRSLDQSVVWYYKQIRDLDLNDLKSKVGVIEENWKPIIGSGSEPFIGSYDGSGFSIKNMVVTSGATPSSDSSQYSGFFVYLLEATVTNLVFENATVDNPDAFNAGILAGRIDNSYIENVRIISSRVSQGSYMGGFTGYTSFSSFENCSVQVTLDSLEDNPSRFVGGFVGYASYSSFSNCSVQDSAITGKVNEIIGGFVGNSDTSVFEDCSFGGTVEDATATYVGGFVGVADIGSDTQDISYFRDCTVSGFISAERNTSVMNELTIGGFVGNASGAKQISFEGCIVQADIEIPHSGFVAGGFFGKAITLHRIYQCGFEGSITGNDEEFPIIGGFGGFVSNTSPGMNIEECYTKFEIYRDTIQNVAGFVTMGDGDMLAITNCYAKGTISSVKVTPTGPAGFAWVNTAEKAPDISQSYATVSGVDYGFLFNYSYGSLSEIQTPYCFWDKDIAGTLNDFSTAQEKTTSEMKQQSTYTNWDFTNVWRMNPSKNDGYPYLAWEDEN
ncbi:MAG: carboxypeptidase-like regulatory domain-containing protein [Pseudothermotoga sp.]